MLNRAQLWDRFVETCVKCYDAHRDGMPGLASGYGALASYWLKRWDEEMR